MEKKIVYWLVFYHFILLRHMGIKQILMRFSKRLITHVFFFFSFVTQSLLTDIDEKSNINLVYRQLQQKMINHGKLHFISKHYLLITHVLNNLLFNDLQFYFDRLFAVHFRVLFQVSRLKLSGRFYYFPTPVHDINQISFVLKIFIQLFRSTYKKRKTTLFTQLYFEFLAWLFDPFSSQLYKELVNLYDIGMENRAFIHYRWLTTREFH